jgi:hypothetical protein
MEMSREEADLIGIAKTLARLVRDAEQRLADLKALESQTLDALTPSIDGALGALTYNGQTIATATEQKFVRDLADGFVFEGTRTALTF